MNIAWAVGVHLRDLYSNHELGAGVFGQQVIILVGRGKMDMADEYVVFVTWHLNQSAVLLGVRMSMTPMEMPSRPVKRYQ